MSWRCTCGTLLRAISGAVAVLQVLAMLQEGDLQTGEAAGATQALRSENEALQARLAQVITTASIAFSSRQCVFLIAKAQVLIT